MLGDKGIPLWRGQGVGPGTYVRDRTHPALSGTPPEEGSYFRR